MANGKKEKTEEDLQSLFDDELKKPYYDVFYLDNFKLPYGKLDVSVVVPTYNRCPYKPNSLKAELNPLAWTIKSALLQKPKINELIIVDDKSKDYTKQVVESFREEATQKEIKLIYLKNEVQMGNGESRNIGSRLANSKYLFFTDDDLIMAPYAVFGSYHIFNLIQTNLIR